MIPTPAQHEYRYKAGGTFAAWKKCTYNGGRLPAGTYAAGDIEVRRKDADGSFSTATSNAATVTATGGAGTFSTITFADGQVWDAGTFVTGTGFKRYNVFARRVLETTATTLTVNVYTNLYPHATWIGVSVFVNGVFNQRITPGANGTTAHVITLPAGVKTVEFQDGLQTSGGNGGANVSGTFVQSVYFEDNTTTVSEYFRPRNKKVFYGDSITSGDGADIPEKNGYAPLVRQALRGTADVAVEAWGWRSLKEDIDWIGIPALAQKLVDLCDGIYTNELWLSIGTNDRGLNKWTSWVDFGAAYADLLDEIHALKADLKIYCMSPVTRVGISNLQLYRDEIMYATLPRPYCEYVNGLDMIAGELDPSGDGTHPITAEHAEFAANVLEVLNGNPFPTPTFGVTGVDGMLLIDNDSRFFTKTGTWNGTTGNGTTDYVGYDNSILLSDTVPATYELTVHTRRFKIASITAPDGAPFEVEIDGVAVTGGTSYDATGNPVSHVIWDSGLLSLGEHTLKVTKTATGRLYLDGVFIQKI